MLFISVKKYKELNAELEKANDLLYSEWKEKYTVPYLVDRAIDSMQEVLRLRLLRTIDKQCIEALLKIIHEDGSALSPFEKSLVDQTLNQ